MLVMEEETAEETMEEGTMEEETMEEGMGVGIMEGMEGGMEVEGIKYERRVNIHPFSCFI